MTIYEPPAESAEPYTGLRDLSPDERDAALRVARLRAEFHDARKNRASRKGPPVHTGEPATVTTYEPPAESAKPYTGLRDLTPDERDEALRGAESHVFHQQHEGSHVQSRWNAMVWMETYSKHGRDKCDKCERTWEAGDPSKPSKTEARALARRWMLGNRGGSDEARLLAWVKSTVEADGPSAVWRRLRVKKSEAIVLIELSTKRESLLP